MTLTKSLTLLRPHAVRTLSMSFLIQTKKESRDPYLGNHPRHCWRRLEKVLGSALSCAICQALLLVFRPIFALKQDSHSNLTKYLIDPSNSKLPLPQRELA